MLATKDPIIFEHDSELSVDEKIDRIVQEKDRRVAEAWTMMPRLFDIWDSDSSGALDKNEVFLGVEQYCEARELSFDSRVISRLWCEVDDNGDQVLDRHEFAVFLARYCEGIGIALDDLAFVVMEQLAGVTPMQGPSCDQGGKPGAAFHRFWALKKRRPRTSYTWAQLKIESEKLSAKSDPSPTWELRRIHHALKPFGSIRIGDDLNEEPSTLKKGEHILLSRLVGASNKKHPPFQIKRRRNSNIRPINKIEAQSLDGFFSVVGEAVKRSESTRMMNISSSSINSA